jgi:CBS domain-containing protein
MLLMDLVTRAPVTVLPETSVLEAARLMRDRNVGSVIVYEEGKVVRILTDRDVVMALADGRFAGVQQGVSELMTRDRVPRAATTWTQGSRAEGAPRAAHAGPQRAGQLVGIVSLDDMLMHMGHTMSTAADLVEDEVAAIPRTPGRAAFARTISGTGSIQREADDRNRLHAPLHLPACARSGILRVFASMAAAVARELDR